MVGVLVVATALPALAREEVYYFINDHLGTPQKLVDQNAQIVWEAEALPFGETIVDEDPDGDGKTVTCNLRFPGQYYDAETGWHYNYHRYYDPKLGRYLRADPVGVGLKTKELYSYANCNPLSLSDQTGLSPCCDEDGNPGKWLLYAWTRREGLFKCWCYWLCCPEVGMVWDPMSIKENFKNVLPRTPGDLIWMPNPPIPTGNDPLQRPDNIATGNFCLCSTPK